MTKLVVTRLQAAVESAQQPSCWAQNWRTSAAAPCWIAAPTKTRTVEQQKRFVALINVLSEVTESNIDCAIKNKEGWLGGHR